MATITAKSSSSQSTSEQTCEPIKIVQREREAILSFACNNVRPGWIVVSTSREIQEINIERLIDEKEHGLKSSSHFLNNRVELDIALDQTTRDKLRDNDDYQIISNSSRSKTQSSSSSFVSLFLKLISKS